MIRFKEIKLLPTEFNLHAYVVGDRYSHSIISNKDRRLLADVFHKRYGAESEYYYSDLDRVDSVQTLNTTVKSESKGSTTIVMVISPYLKSLVHELIHVLWHLSHTSGLDMDYNSQEWQACMYEYLFTELKDFRKIPVI